MSVPPRQFTPEQIEFVRERIARKVLKTVIAKEFEERFGESLCQLQLQKMMQRNGIENIPRRMIFTSEQEEFVWEQVLQEVPQRQICREFERVFHRKLAQSQLRRMMARSGIESVRKEQTMLPVGTERYSKYYRCMMIKTNEYSIVGEPDRKKADYLRNKQWQFKQNYIWERTHHKKLPKGYVVIFLDGDRMNYDPINLHAVRLEVSGNVEKWGMHSEDPELYRAALLYGELYFATMKNAPEIIDTVKRF